MSSRQIRTEFAELLAGLLDIQVDPFAPTQLRTGSGFIVNGDPYLSHIDEQATFRRPVLRLSLLLVAPAIDMESATDWIDDRYQVLLAQLAANRQAKVGGAVRPTPIDVTEFGVVDGKAIAFQVRFTPILTGEPTT